MEELINVMEQILSELQMINSKLDDIRGSGINSVDDICNKLDDIRGSGINSLDDLCGKLDTIDTTLSGIDLSISMID